MSTAPSLTRDIGQLERTLRAVLDRQLEQAGLSFSEWTTLVFLDSAGPLHEGEIIQRQLAGRVATKAAAKASVDSLRSSGLIAAADAPHSRSGDRDDHPLALTVAGKAAFRPTRRAVSRIADDLHRDLPQADLDATHRTLTEIARRANEALSRTS